MNSKISCLGKKSDQQVIVEEIKICHAEKMVYAQSKICSKNETHKILWDFQIQRDLQTPTRRPDSELINNKKN